MSGEIGPIFVRGIHKLNGEGAGGAALATALTRTVFWSFASEINASVQKETESIISAIRSVHESQLTQWAFLYIPS